MEYDVQHSTHIYIMLQRYTYGYVHPDPGEDDAIMARTLDISNGSNQYK